MMKAHCVLALAGLLLAVPGTLTASAAESSPVSQAAPYAVSIAVNDASPELGKRLVLHGRVSPLPARATRVIVTLQVRYEGQRSWRSLTRMRLAPDGRYQLTARAKSVRDRRYRVTVSNAAGRVAGVSRVQRVNVYTWRDLTTLTPLASNGLVEVPSVTALGRDFPNSISTTSSAHGIFTIDYDLKKACIRFRATPLWGYVDFAAWMDGNPTAVGGSVGFPNQTNGPLPRGSRLQLFISVLLDGYLSTLGTPRVLCDPDVPLT